MRLVGPATSARGIYCLANDPVLGWFEPFVHSLRRHEPTLPIAVIPYDERTSGIRRLAPIYNFDVWDDHSLTSLDELGAHFTPGSPRRRHNFRKLAVFWGPFEQFLFLDIDIVVLDRIEPMLDVYTRSGLDLVYLDASMNSVYRTEAFRQQMVEDHGSVGWNSGTWLSRRGCTSLRAVTEVYEQAMPHLEGELMRWGEQTFLNYVSDVHGWSRASLADLDASMPCSSWARHRAVEGEAPMTIVHWAGDDPSPLMPRQRDYLRHRLPTLGTLGARLRFLLLTWPTAGLRVLLSRIKRALRR